MPKGHVNDQLNLMLEELETILETKQVQHALALLTNAKHGATDSEMIDLLAFDENFHSSSTHGMLLRSFCFKKMTAFVCSDLGASLSGLVEVEQAFGSFPPVVADGRCLRRAMEG